MSMSSPSKSPTMEPAELSHPHPKASVTHEHQQVASPSYINNNIINTRSPNKSPRTGNSLTTNVESAGAELSDDETSFNNDQKNKDDDFFNSFPPGYRFNPYDEELVVHYLKRKVLDQPLPRNRIIEVNLYRYNPEVLAEKYEKYGEKEWYFFTPRDRKYRNGSRPKRAAGDGYWKATGADKNIYSDGSHVGFRKALVFYKGKPPRGDKTNWIMHEFRVKNSPVRSRKGENDMRLDRWVLCRIYKKATNSKGRNNNTEDPAAAAEEHSPLRQPHIINGTEMMEFEQMSSIVDPYMEYENNYSMKAASAAAAAACGMPNVGGHLLQNNIGNRFQAFNINNGGASYANMGQQQQHQHQQQLPVRPPSMPLMPESLLGSRYLDDSSITQDDTFFDMKFGNGAYGSMNNYQGQFSPLDQVFPYTE